MSNKMGFLGLVVFGFTGCVAPDSPPLEPTALRATSTEELPVILPVASAPVVVPTPSPSASPAPVVPYGFSGGDGTLASPYSLRTINDLKMINTALSAHYNLDENINMDGVTDWTPIGTPETPFSGEIQGYSRMISMIDLKRTDGSTLAFFGAISGTVVQVQLDGKMTSNGYAAGLTGVLKSTAVVSNCQIHITAVSGLGGNGVNTGIGTLTYVTREAHSTLIHMVEDGRMNGNLVYRILDLH